VDDVDFGAGELGAAIPASDLGVGPGVNFAGVDVGEQLRREAQVLPGAGQVDDGDDASDNGAEAQEGGIGGGRCGDVAGGKVDLAGVEKVEPGGGTDGSYAMGWEFEASAQDWNQRR
jgi:hypothetical protein